MYNNKTKYFKHCNTEAEVKKEYRKLAMLHHPDLGGSVEIMAEINSEYLVALKNVSGTSERQNNGSERTYYYSESVEASIVQKIDEIIRLGLCGIDDLVVELVGTWIWITGETKKYKDQIKQIEGIKYSGARSAWCWHNGKHFYSRASKKDFNGIKAQYGSSVVRAERETVASN